MAITLDTFREMVGQALTNSHGHHSEIECTDCSVYTVGIVAMFKAAVEDTYALGATDGALIAREGEDGMAQVMRKFLDAMPTAEDPHDPTPPTV